jgi:hypothetical protein
MLTERLRNTTRIGGDCAGSFLREGLELVDHARDARGIGTFAGTTQAHPSDRTAAKKGTVAGALFRFVASSPKRDRAVFGLWQ